MKNCLTILFLFGFLPVFAQDHGHLNIGAISQTQGSKLTFDNGPDFLGTYVKTLTFTNSGKFANRYQGNITLTALHSTDPFGEPIPTAPAPGSFIIAEIVSVQGPEGGAFEFWDTNSTTSPAVSIPVGTTTPGFQFEVSEGHLGAGEPGGDPYGHFHGRRFTVTKPGLYKVGFKALDISINGTGGGAIHPSSDPIEIQFQGGVNLTHLEIQGHATISLGALAGYLWQLQSKDDLSIPVWADVGEPVPGNDNIIELFDHRSAVPSRFYQAIGIPIEP